MDVHKISKSFDTLSYLQKVIFLL